MIDTQNRAAAGFKLIVVAFLFQFLLGENGNIERKCPVRIFIRTGDSKTQVPSSDGYIVAVIVAAVFLGPDIIFVHGGGASFIAAMVSGMMLVYVCLSGTHAIIADLIHVFAEKQAQADSGQGFNLRVFDGMNVKKNAAIRKYGNSIAYTWLSIFRMGWMDMAATD